MSALPPSDVGGDQVNVADALPAVATTFVVTAGMFGALALYGSTTKKSLAGLGHFVGMGLIGLLLAMVVGFFWKAPALQFVISVVGVLVFSTASLLCGLAWNIAVLDIARALQGIGGAALFATALALIGAEYRGPEIGGAIAIWGATVGAAVASGPLVGGILTDALDWRWVFFVNVPVGAFALWVAVTRMRESRDPQATHTDVWGLVTFSTSLFLIVFGVLRGNASGWSSALILGSLVGGAVLLAVFVAVEHRQTRPMLDLSLFRHPGFVGVSVATFCIGAGMFALFPYLSIYLQDVLGYTPLGAGLRFLPLTVFVFVVPLSMRKLAPDASLRLVLAGGLALVAAAPQSLTVVDVWPSLALVLGPEEWGWSGYFYSGYDQQWGAAHGGAPRIGVFGISSNIELEYRVAPLLTISGYLEGALTPLPYAAQRDLGDLSDASEFRLRLQVSLDVSPGTAVDLGYDFTRWHASFSGSNVLNPAGSADQALLLEAREHAITFGIRWKP